MDFIWIIVGMPIFCGIYGIYRARENRIEEERSRKGVVGLNHQVIARNSTYKPSIEVLPKLSTISGRDGRALKVTKEGSERSGRGDRT